MKVQRNHHYCIIDEIDSILIDEARTPLIISGQAERRIPKGNFQEVNQGWVPVPWKGVASKGSCQSGRLFRKNPGPEIFKIRRRTSKEDYRSPGNKGGLHGIHLGRNLAWQRTTQGIYILGFPCSHGRNCEQNFFGNLTRFGPNYKHFSPQPEGP